MFTLSCIQYNWTFAAKHFLSILFLTLYSQGLLALERPNPTPFSQVEWQKTDFAKHSISYDSVVSGGPPKDGIPAIDNPKFDSIRDAQKWLQKLEPVIRLTHNNEAKAYPIQILMFHEIVNDSIADKKVSVTFCPLCNTSIVFDREVDGRLLDFGTTGKLRNSDLIMYDRQTESWWQQFTGEGIVGFYTRHKLIELDSVILSFEQFSLLHPNGKVLNRNTGYERQYGNNPYRGYDNINSIPFLMREESDLRLPPMTRVISLSHLGKTKIYPFSEIKKADIVHDKFAGKSIVIFQTGKIYSALDKRKITESRTIKTYRVFSTEMNNKFLTFEKKSNKIVDLQTSSEWNIDGLAVNGKLKGKRLLPISFGEHFAFAWLAFNPKTEIYRHEQTQ